MFEKEAEEYLTRTVCQGCRNICEGDCAYAKPIRRACLEMAEFGYNKANEWHYVKDELPELYKDVLVIFPQGDCEVKYLTKHNEWVGRGSWCSLADVIAWKEIVLPKEIKENE